MRMRKRTYVEMEVIMDKKMTSGELAKKAGVSQKAIRLYGEKGLLKPSDYSEGNYRLYDKEALLVLEKIIALKKIGFSLEEIKEHLKCHDGDDILSVLEEQLQMMERKKVEIEKSITCIKNAIARSNGTADWDLVADIIRKIQIDQKADEGHFDALKHSVDSVDWYVKVYDSLNIAEGEKVLDLGCGFGKLWRNNWERIPKNTKVFAYDLHGSWAEHFSQFISEQGDRLSGEVDIQVLWGDVEEAETWDTIQKQKYSLIIANYLSQFLNNEEKLLERASSVLDDHGVFTMTGNSSGERHLYIKKIFGELGLDTRFLEECYQGAKKKHHELEEMLKQYFGSVETVLLSSCMGYEDSNEILEKLYNIYPEQKKYLVSNEGTIRNYFDKWIEENGNFILKSETEFWHCRK